MRAVTVKHQGQGAHNAPVGVHPGSVHGFAHFSRLNYVRLDHYIGVGGSQKVFQAARQAHRGLDHFRYLLVGQAVAQGRRMAESAVIARDKAYRAALLRVVAQLRKLAPAGVRHGRLRPDREIQSDQTRKRHDNKDRAAFYSH